jgi:hypothetical protein
MSVHVHGQYSKIHISVWTETCKPNCGLDRAPFDGWAADYAQPGQYKVSEGIGSTRFLALTSSRTTTTQMPKTLGQSGIM